MRRSVLLGSALLLVVAGCKKSDPNEKIVTAPGATASAIPGMKEFKLEHLSISVPEDWKTFDFTAGNFEKMLEDTEKNQPSFAKFAPQVRTLAANKAYKLFAFDMKNASNGFADNVNVMETPAPKGMSFEKLIEVNRTQATQLGKVIREKDDQINGQRWHTWELEMEPGAAPVALRLFLYLTLQDDRMDLVTFTAQKPHGDSMKKAAETSMRTVTLH